MKVKKSIIKRLQIYTKYYYFDFKQRLVTLINNNLKNVVDKNYTFEFKESQYDDIINYYSHNEKTCNKILEETENEEKALMEFIDKIAKYEINPNVDKSIIFDFMKKKIYEEKTSDGCSVGFTSYGYSYQLGKKKCEIKIDYQECGNEDFLE